MLACGMVLSSALIIQPLRTRLDDDRDPAHRVRIDAPGQSVRLIVTTPRLRPIALVAFSYGAMQLCLFAFFVTYLVEHVGLDLVTAGLLFAVMQGAGFVARVGWGWVSDRWMSTRPLLAALGAGTIASTVAAIAFSDAWPLAGLAAASVALGATGVGWNGIYLAEVARAVPLDKVGPATGGVLMFTFVGVVLGPSTFGAIVATTGSWAAAFIAMDALVLATVVVLVIRPRSGGPAGGPRSGPKRGPHTESEAPSSRQRASVSLTPGTDRHTVLRPAVPNRSSLLGPVRRPRRRCRTRESPARAKEEYR